MIVQYQPRLRRRWIYKARDGQLGRTLQEYTQFSTLHGLRYLVENGRPWTERLWWILSVFSSLLVITSLILQAWQKWTQSPVLVSFADKPTPVWEIPFPTITVCPSNKYRKQVFDMSKTWRVGRDNLSLSERKISDDLMLVCPKDAALLEDHLRTANYPMLSDEDTLRNIITVAPTLSDSVGCLNAVDASSCMWMLNKIVTKEGVCYTYNAQQSLYHQELEPRRKVWSLESGYLAHVGSRELPRRAFAGLSRGVLLGLKTNTSEMDYTCREMQGFKIALTNPASVPKVQEQFYFVPINGLTHMAVMMHVTDTDDVLRKYPSHQRHCYFPSERRLAFFSTYTQDNCDVECLSNYTLRACRCVNFYMPRNITTPVCGYGSYLCTYLAEQALDKEFMEEKINQFRSEHTCDCLPSCKSIEYSAEISQSSLEFDQLKSQTAKEEVDKKLKGIQFNGVFIFLKQSEFLAVRRRELYGVMSFVANCGGLLGLCCGFSLLSLAELVYFFTLRLWNNARTADHQEVADKWKGSKISRVTARNMAWY